jgi:hypothetical protein
MNDIKQITVMKILEMLNDKQRELYKTDAYFNNFIRRLVLNNGRIPIEEIINIVHDLCKSNKIRLDKIGRYAEKYGHIK